jgi:hypothetical protein
LDQTVALPAGRLLELRYEIAVTQPAQTAERVADFLDVTDPPARRALHAAFGTARPDSIGRWRTRLDDAGRADVEKEAGELLSRLGYA